ETTLQRLARAGTAGGRFAIFAGSDQPRCATQGFRPSAPGTSNFGSGENIRIANGEALRTYLFDSRGGIEGIAEFPRQTLTDLTYIPGTSTNFGLDLIEGDRTLRLRDGSAGGPLYRAVEAEALLADKQLRLRMKLATPPMTPLEFLIMTLPLLMWAAAATIGWIIISRLLLRPLGRMQRAVSAYQPGDSEIAMPRFSTPAREIGELGEAFNRVTRTVARHEAELESAVERQTRLVREVHHRVKNNLQVVASLLNLHSRGSRNEDVAAAYASIQRRVDALAVVHRNHYAELEENRGVSLRSLLSELGANLKATAPQSAARMTIRLDVEPYYVNQDVAVSVAFLVTEIIEFAMFCGARSVTVSLTGEEEKVARLAIESESLRNQQACDELLTERFNRIVTGLSRQLRSVIDKDEENGRYALNIAVVSKAER
ncbi:MAG TPA: histidine kinase dimerization/phosphoacceptor domain -containing protein, partial [Allosphingosinicella sp.]|nr:histidine kinase dimerization/phosphoacceptor domain -containing protein [Allosphingosinicella sp.]